MKDFKSGVCNTLIATCVAEEGIDVGEVDLIVCFDVNNKNTTRYIQRIGRTGRKRQGKVIMLVTEGKEQSILREVMATKDGTNQKISKSTEVKKALYRDSPRMVPPTFHPQCVETFIKIDDEETPAVDLSTNTGPSTSKSKKAKTKSNKRVQPVRGSKQPDIRQALVKRVELDDEILRDFDVPHTLNTSTMSRGIHDETASELFRPAEMSMHRSDGGDISMKEKFLKICERYREIRKCASAETKPLDAAAVINNDKLAKPLKMLWLKNNLDFVREHYNRQKTSRLYASIAKIIGGDQAVQRLLLAPTEQWSNMKPMRQMSIFQIFNLVDREVKENVPENGPDDTQVVALALESQQSFGFVESKYASQFESQLLGVPPPVSHNDAISSSTPKRLNKTAASHVQSPIDSPIKRLQSASTYERTRKNKKDIPDTVPHYLRFLGLRSIDDLFGDSDDEVDADPLPNVVEEEKTDANSNKIPVNELAESDLFADESVAFTRAPQSITTAATTTTTTKRVNRLNVGSISDLFRDEDFEDNEDDDNDAAAMGETISKTGSDDTEEYDFEEIISIMEIAEAAADPRGKENQNGNQEAKVVQQKSDDLFATYNETIETNANGSSANRTNVSHFSVPTPPKASATKKDREMSADSNSLQSPSTRLNYAIIQDKSPSVLNRSSQSRSHSGASSKSLLGKFNATLQSVDAQSDVNHSFRFGSPSTSGHPEKLNFARLKANAAAPPDSMSQDIAFSQFLTCREATTSAQDAFTVKKTHIDQMDMNISTESETPDEDEIFATCQMVDDKNFFMTSLHTMVGPHSI